MGLGDTYRDGHQRLARLATSLDETTLDRYVPLNPAWRIRDVIAHSVGVCEDVLAGNYPDSLDPKRQPDQANARDAWTQAQVDRRRDQPIRTVLAEWDLVATKLEPLLNSDALPAGSQLQTGPPFDVGCHLHDVRHALAQPGDRDAPITRLAFALGRGWLNLRLQSAQLPALRLRTPDREWAVGEGPPGATLAGDGFDLFRALTGRRSRQQVLGLDWDGARMMYLDVLSPYPFPEQEVIE